MTTTEDPVVFSIAFTPTEVRNLLTLLEMLTTPGQPLAGRIKEAAHAILSEMAARLGGPVDLGSLVEIITRVVTPEVSHSRAILKEVLALVHSIERQTKLRLEPHAPVDATQAAKDLKEGRLSPVAADLRATRGTTTCSHLLLSLSGSCAACGKDLRAPSH